MEISRDDISHQKWMEVALQEARLAFDEGEVPVGAVLVRNGELVARNHNRREKNNSAIAHAEILVIEEGNRQLGTWRLSECTLYVTLEPCVMCAGAVVNSRVSTVVYGCKDPKAGAVESLYQILGDQRLNHRPEVIAGVCAEEASAVLKTFFVELRNSRKSFFAKLDRHFSGGRG
ncbi:MAG: tRNA-specific adenosine deaminase [Proteobacteria bacterium SG_bin7]|nr:MAG: tRNA-specific adenosine deaminase [Proteobacteria bacterium SG_bin7]